MHWTEETDGDLPCDAALQTTAPRTESNGGTYWIYVEIK